MAAIAAAVTVVAALMPERGAADAALPLRVTLQTVIALLAVPAAALLARRCRADPAPDRVYLALAAGSLAISALAVVGLLTVAPDSGMRVPVDDGGVLAAAVLLAIAAWTPGRVARPGAEAAWPTRRAVRAGRLSEAARPLGRSARTGSAGPQAAGAVRRWTGPLAVTAVALAAGALLAVGAAPEPHPPDARLHAHSGLAASAVHIAAVLAFAAAAAGFARRRDTLAPFITAGAALALLAEVNHLILPPARAELVHLADGLRLVFVAAILLGALTEAVREWRRAADAAVRRERRRIARDLHDGVTQELVYIERRAVRLADTALGREIAAAVERALHDSRRAVGRLADTNGHEPLRDILAAVAARSGVALELRAPPDLALQPEPREAVLRIVAEAVRNAARHGRARTVRVDLEPGPPLRLTIVDDGAGFQPKRAHGGTFGLIGMRDRAEELGGALRVRSRPGGGTEIEVELP